MTEFQINGITYSCSKLNAFDQFHVFRRLAPVLSVIGVDISKAKDDPMALFNPVAKAIGDMSNADSEYVLNTCLGAVRRRQGDKVWAPLMSRGGLQFDDVQLPEMLQITWHVLQENFSNFLAVLPGSAPGGQDSPTSNG